MPVSFGVNHRRLSLYFSGLGIVSHTQCELIQWNVDSNMGFIWWDFITSLVGFWQRLVSQNSSHVFGKVIYWAVGSRAMFYVCFISVWTSLSLKIISPIPLYPYGESKTTCSLANSFGSCFFLLFNVDAPYRIICTEWALHWAKKHK